MNPPTLQLSTTSKGLLGATGGLLALVWLVRFVYLPVIARIGEQQAVLHDLNVKIGDTRVLADQLPQEQAALDQARADQQALTSRVAGGQSVARILEQLGELATDHRVELGVVQPRTEETEEATHVSVGGEMVLQAVPLGLELHGRYHQIGEFLGALPNAPFLASIQQLSLARPEDGSAQLRADLLMAVYVAEPDPQP